MNAQPARHIVEIASDAVRAIYRGAVPLRALIEGGDATGNVFVGFPGELQIAPGSPVVVHAGLNLPPAVRETAKADGCRIIRDYDNPRGLLAQRDATAGRIAQLVGKFEQELAETWTP
jgi:hypothetical protein